MNPVRSQKSTPHTHTLVPPAAHDELLAWLRESGSTLSPAEAIGNAIRLWIARGRADAAPVRGYQWKQLFLPESTRVRVRFAGDWHHAEVAGDDLIYQGSPVSPNQMTRQVTGDVRNAWRELWIRFPGEKSWTNADRLRARPGRQAVAPPLSPADAMAAAAKSMSDALSTALTLVEHVNHQSQNTLERRLPRYRRAHDRLDDVH